MALGDEAERGQFGKCPQRSLQRKFIQEGAEWKRTANWCRWTDGRSGEVVDS